MADVLSQAVIDALLSSLSSGEVHLEEVKHKEAERTVKIYDIRIIINEIIILNIFMSILTLLLIWLYFFTQNMINFVE